MADISTIYNRTRIEFADGTAVDTVFPPLGGTATHQSAYRKTIEYRIPYDAMTFEDIEKLYTNPDAMGKVNIVEYGTEINSETGDTKEIITAQSQKLNYTMPMDLKLTTINDIKVWNISMAQMSDVEIMQIEQGAVLDALLQEV